MTATVRRNSGEQKKAKHMFKREQQEQGEDNPYYAGSTPTNSGSSMVGRVLGEVLWWGCFPFAAAVWCAIVLDDDRNALNADYVNPGGGVFKVLFVLFWLLSAGLAIWNGKRGWLLFGYIAGSLFVHVLTLLVGIALSFMFYNPDWGTIRF